MMPNWGRRSDKPSAAWPWAAPKVTYTLFPSKVKTVAGAPFYGGVSTPSSSGGTI